jgi:hypothetical protein
MDETKDTRTPEHLRELARLAATEAREAAELEAARPAKVTKPIARIILTPVVGTPPPIGVKRIITPPWPLGDAKTNRWHRDA